MSSSTITATILSKNLSFKRSSPLRKKSVSGAQNNKVSEPRHISVAINSFGTDADEVITEALP